MRVANVEIFTGAGMHVAFALSLGRAFAGLCTKYNPPVSVANECPIFSL